MAAGGAPASDRPPPPPPSPASPDAAGGGGGLLSEEEVADGAARRALLYSAAAAEYAEEGEGGAAAAAAAATAAAPPGAAAAVAAAGAAAGGAAGTASGTPTNGDAAEPAAGAPPGAAPDPSPTPAGSVLTPDLPVEAVLQELSVPIDGGEVHLRLEALGGRRRRMSGGIYIEAPLDRVWAVLTQYARMDEFLPNIVSSAVREGRDGGVLLDQTGIISRRLQLKSRMVMRVTEVPKSSITFSRVKGRDFTAFEGVYMFREVDAGTGGCQLDYSLDAVPMPFFPVALVERKIVKEMPKILAAIRREALDNAVLQLDWS